MSSAAEVFEMLKTLPLPPAIEPGDPDDAFLVSMARAGDADYLVTGVRRAGLLQFGNVGHTRIRTPTRFCAEAL